MRPYDIYKWTNGTLICQIHGKDNAAATAKKYAQTLEIPIGYCNGQERPVMVEPVKSAWWVPDESL